LITVRCLGHIKSSVGSEVVNVDAAEIEASALVDRLRSMSKESDPGFNRYNTLAMVGDGDAFLPASSSRKVRDGDEVVLIPFSHGG
jgi:molybdopterin converting factor small subunit